MGVSHFYIPFTRRNGRFLFRGFILIAKDPSLPNDDLNHEKYTGRLTLDNDTLESKRGERI